jgi:pentatricopeptide repeat protein
MNFLGLMIFKEHEPDVIAYSTLIDGLSKKSEIEKAMNTIDDMISKGHESNVVTYNIFIGGLL